MAKIKEPIIAYSVKSQNIKRTLTLSIDEKVYENIISFLQLFPKSTIEIIEDDIFASSDEKIFQESMEELKQGKQFHSKDGKKNIFTKSKNEEVKNIITTHC